MWDTQSHGAVLNALHVSRPLPVLETVTCAAPPVGGNVMLSLEIASVGVPSTCSRVTPGAVGST
jgi:hypothetical protein